MFSLYKSAIGGKFCVWNEEYPTIDDATSDFESGGLWGLFIDGELVGALSEVHERELDNFDFWQIKSRHTELARIVISQSQRGKGYAKVMLEHMIDNLFARGASAIHISVARENIPALKTYEKLGFRIMGEEKLYGGDYYLVEKVL